MLLELKVIHMRMCPIGDLITVLRCEGMQESDIVYPSLHALEFEKIDFGPDEPGNLHDVISMRAKHAYGVCIHKLRFVVCKILMNKEVWLLEDVVAVDWDRHAESSKPASLGCTWNGDPDSRIDSEFEADPDSDVHLK
ncbi:hypothetical protein DFH29DRAFT_874545 [Suillus ampliporus]|nr:hypothetical protein DFH29DRAFT_874545 [Suillus ampliporus]